MMPGGRVVFTDAPTAVNPEWNTTKWGGACTGNDGQTVITSGGTLINHRTGTPDINTGFDSMIANTRWLVEWAVNMTIPDPTDKMWEKARIIKGHTLPIAKKYWYAAFELTLGLSKLYPRGHVLLLTHDYITLCDAVDEDANYDPVPRIYTDVTLTTLTNGYYARIANDGTAFNVKAGFQPWWSSTPTSPFFSSQVLRQGEDVAKIWRGTEPGWQNYFGPNISQPATYNVTFDGGARYPTLNVLTSWTSFTTTLNSTSLEIGSVTSSGGTDTVDNTLTAVTRLSGWY